MSYFKADNKKIIKIIKNLTYKKSCINQKELYENIPRDWKLDGFGTGNLQTCLIDLCAKNFIEGAQDFYKEEDIKNNDFRLTELGKQVLVPGYRKKNTWIFIFALITALSTLGTFMLFLLDKLVALFFSFR